jgi:hypothetical protein
MFHFGDDVPHDCDLNAGVPEVTGSWSTGVDPGRDGNASTFADNLDLQNVLADMATNNVMLIECQTDGSYSEYWTWWTGITGGQFVLSSEPTVSGDVIEAVMAGITTTSVTNVHIEAQLGYEAWVNSAWSYTGSNKTFDDIQITFTVPAGTPAGTHTFNVYVVDDAGIIYGVQNVIIHVKPVTVKSIVPNSGSNTTTVRISNLAGTGFVSNASVKLTRDLSPPIVASPVSVDSEKKITCTFNLTGAQPGLWTVVVTNPDGGSASLIDGFTINAPTRIAKK